MSRIASFNLRNDVISIGECYTFSHQLVDERQLQHARDFNLYIQFAFSVGFHLVHRKIQVIRLSRLTYWPQYKNYRNNFMYSRIVIIRVI